MPASRAGEATWIDRHRRPAEAATPCRKQGVKLQCGRNARPWASGKRWGAPLCGWNATPVRSGGQAFFDECVRGRASGGAHGTWPVHRPPEEAARCTRLGRHRVGHGWRLPGAVMPVGATAVRSTSAHAGGIAWQFSRREDSLVANESRGTGGGADLKADVTGHPRVFSLEGASRAAMPVSRSARRARTRGPAALPASGQLIRHTRNR